MINRRMCITWYVIIGVLIMDGVIMFIGFEMSGKFSRNVTRIRLGKIRLETFFFDC